MAVSGVSSRGLDLTSCDVGEVLDMVEARKKTVDELLEHGYTWKEEIAILKGMELVSMNDRKEL